MLIFFIFHLHEVKSLSIKSCKSLTYPHRFISPLGSVYWLVLLCENLSWMHWIHHPQAETDHLAEHLFKPPWICEHPPSPTPQPFKMNMSSTQDNASQNSLYFGESRFCLVATSLVVTKMKKGGGKKKDFATSHILQNHTELNATCNQSHWFESSPHVKAITLFKIRSHTKVRMSHEKRKNPFWATKESTKTKESEQLFTIFFYFILIFWLQNHTTTWADGSHLITASSTLN